jgi:hypothetical protein
MMSKFLRKCTRCKNLSEFCHATAHCALCKRSRVAALTHKIKWSHCYFFLAVVIRMQCRSIRDCTAPIRHPLKLGGQQWRRREKRKLRRRSRRRRRLARRSSRRYSVFDIACVEDRVTRAGQRRGRDDLPRRAGSGERQGASAGRKVQAPASHQRLRKYVTRW